MHTNSNAFLMTVEGSEIKRSSFFLSPRLQEVQVAAIYV